VVESGPARLVGERTAGNGSDAYAVQTAVNDGSEPLIFVPLRVRDRGYRDSASSLAIGIQRPLPCEAPSICTDHCWRLAAASDVPGHCRLSSSVQATAAQKAWIGPRTCSARRA
jgi:hypothetical protein